jgi:hypothetical protein
VRVQGVVLLGPHIQSNRVELDWYEQRHVSRSPSRRHPLAGQ